jgi:hypothetical protein
MSNINLNKHYAAFKWAVSTNWKDKNGLYSAIQYKIHVLTNEYGLTEEEIAIELFEEYWERGHYLKYDEAKGSLNNWIAGYVCFYLNNLIRRYAVRAKNNPAQKIDPLDPRNWANIEWIDRDNEKEDADYQPEIIFDPISGKTRSPISWAKWIWRKRPKCPDAVAKPLEETWIDGKRISGMP